MRENRTPHENSPPLAYEATDFNPRHIHWFLAGFAFSLFLLLVSVWWSFNTVSKAVVRTNPQASPFADLSPTFPEPSLQPSPKHSSLDWQDYQQLHGREQQLLDSYKWVNPQAGIAQIPVSRAMQITAQRGVAEISHSLLITTPPTDVPPPLSPATQQGSPSP